MTGAGDGTAGRATTVVLDLDGTLVDSVLEHSLAWQAAFRDVGLDVPACRLQRLIGMGGDRLVTAAAGEAAEASLGDELRRLHREHLDELFGRIVPTPGAAALVDALRRHGMRTVLASSSDEQLTRRLLDVVPEAAVLLDGAVTGSQVQRSKPSGELVEAALAGLDDPGSAVVVGDAVWDVHAARDAGAVCVALLTGGLCEGELREAGAVAVHADASGLADHLDQHGRLA